MKIKIHSKLLIRLGKLFTPFILGFGVYGLWGLLSDELVKIWPLLIAYFFPPFGKETVIPLGVGLLKEGLTIPLLNLQVQPVSINPISMALAVAFIDIVVALFLIWNYDIAKKIPLIGQFMIKVEKIGRSSSDKYAWVKPLRFIGIILFVMVPFQGSGGLVASILGRLIGMKPLNTFFAISLGAVTGCLLIAYFSELMRSIIVKNFLLGLLIIIIVVLIAIMIWIYRNNNNFLKKH
jgi:uncharacterized membrane protein